VAAAEEHHWARACLPSIRRYDDVCAICFVFFLTIIRFCHLGMVTILMNDFPQFKWLLIASLGFFVLVNRCVDVGAFAFFRFF
jgi:hypothetical protein